MSKLKEKVTQFFGSCKKSLSCHTASGGETPDPTPLAVSVGFKKPPTIHELIGKYLKAASEDAAMKGYDSFEEADDFDVGDDYDPKSPYELHFDALAEQQHTQFQEEQPADGGQQKPPKQVANEEKPSNPVKNGQNG